METPITTLAPPNKRIFDLRPMSIGDLLDRVVYFYRHHFVAIVLYSTALNAPLALLLFFTTVLTNIPLIAPDMLATNPEVVLSGSLLAIVLSLAVSLLTGFTTAFQVAGIAVGVRDFVLTGKRSTVREMWGGVRERLGKVVALVFVLILVTIVAGIISLITALTVIGIPFVLAFLTIGGIAMTLSYTVIMYENVDAVEAVRRAWLLVCSGRRRIIALFILYYLFTFLIGMTFGALVALLAGMGSAFTENPVFLVIIQPIVQLLILVFVNPLVYAVASMIYFDLRIRSEGLDVALMSAAAAGEPLDLAAAPVMSETAFGPMPRRTLLTLGGIYTVVVALLCALISGFAFLVGTI